MTDCKKRCCLTEAGSEVLCLNRTGGIKQPHWKTAQKHPGRIHEA